MRAAFLALGLTACGFQHGVDSTGTSDRDGGTSLDGAGDASLVDAATCGWSYLPTNFNLCALPAPMPLVVTGAVTIDTAMTTLPKLTLTQSDNTTITVIHLSSFALDPAATLTVTGTGVVFAVDGKAILDGTIIAAGGSDLATHCDSARGKDGGNSFSSQNNTGGGGGGGASAADSGGGGGNGGGFLAGTGAVRGTKIGTSMMTPLRAGCRGGSGGHLGLFGTSPPGGRGGGAIQISTNALISLTGVVDAAGRGGAGGQSARVGGAGGGSGGAILLEGPTIELAPVSKLCADGGSGGEGGGALASGHPGQTSPCSTLAAATTEATMGTSGGIGGDGGFRLSTTGLDGHNATGGSGGGGGGGSVGWVRLKSADLHDAGAHLTPTPTN